MPSGETASSAAGNLRVMAVGARGLVALYRPEYEQDSGSVNSIGGPILPSSDVVIDDHQDPLAAANAQMSSSADDISVSELDVSQQWKLRQVSLIHQKVLVIAEVAWPVQRSADGQSSDYLVTWEVDGGGLKGHLYTDATSVTLSLWPDTVYHIQVDLVTASQDAVIQLRSSPLTIDTHKAPTVQSDESRPLPAAPLIDRLPSSSSALPSSSDSSSGNSSGAGRRLEATVGVGAAAGISLFLLVLATAIGVRRHRQASSSMNLDSSSLAANRDPRRRHTAGPFTIGSVKTIDVERSAFPPCAVHSLQHCLAFQQQQRSHQQQVASALPH